VKRFSERYGFRPVKSVVQIDSMDNDLRNSLWNATTIHYWDSAKSRWHADKEYRYRKSLIHLLWRDFYKKPLDSIRFDYSTNLTIIKNKFYKSDFYEAYDLIEFLANNDLGAYRVKNAGFIDTCNKIMEKELSAYRFVGGIITRITSGVELDEIEEALSISNPFNEVHTHLEVSLRLFSNRKDPDYRNSVKESILAVEAICKKIIGDSKATLGKALKKIEQNINIHPSLKRSFMELYGYTSDGDGIRHALTDEDNTGFEDAKYMLVSCSAFINYLIAKADKAGLHQRLGLD